MKRNHVASRVIVCAVCAWICWNCSLVRGQDESLAQARQALQEYIDKVTTHPDQWHHFTEWTLNQNPRYKLIYQIRGLQLDVRPTTVSLEDDLNGITWVGQATISYGATREFQWENGNSDSWSEWRKGTTETTTLRRKHGRWETQVPPLKRLYGHDVEFTLARPTAPTVEWALSTRTRDEKWHEINREKLPAEALPRSPK